LKKVERPPACIENFIAKSRCAPRRSQGLQRLGEIEFFNRIDRDCEFAAEPDGGPPTGARA
jgi:hypothetical protein